MTALQQILATQGWASISFHRPYDQRQTADAELSMAP
jgi:hypothetical protein